MSALPEVFARVSKVVPDLRPGLRANWDGPRWGHERNHVVYITSEEEASDLIIAACVRLLPWWTWSESSGECRVYDTTEQANGEHVANSLPIALLLAVEAQAKGSA